MNPDGSSDGQVSEGQMSVRDAFDAALELTGEDRAAFVQRVCAADPDRRARVEKLLAAHRKAGEFLAQPSVEVATLPGEQTGSTIGAYTLVEQIGEGGFGAVFLAEQSAPIRRRVALKITKLGMDTRRVIARFEAERQALALMDHPGIAHVYDGGATDSGRPYFVMELVRGEPVTTFCSAARMSVRERLALFQQVCEAVQHAHQKGVIHRDLKPSNVLVASVDGRPAPKIIDFGIAKATAAANDDFPDTTLLADRRQLLGTPQYMSPEQADGSPDIDTRSDIYSLGALLFELLTGTTPFDPHRLRSVPLEEVQRIIREETPPRPSTTLTRADPGTPPPPLELLSPSLRSDLDWIVMKCLEKERARRYQTANALALDIGRHLAGEPVLAAPPSRAYRLHRFLRRHRAQVIASLLIAASLLAAAIGTATFAIREARRADETDRMFEFQSRLLSGIVPSRMGATLHENILEQAAQDWRRRGRDTEIASLQADLDARLSGITFTSAALRGLDQHLFQGALQEIDATFADQPLLKAEVLQNLAHTLAELGLHEQAMAPQTQALEIRARLLPARDARTLESRLEMARLLAKRSRFLEGEPYARAALEGRLATLGENHEDTLASRYVLGHLLMRQNRFGPSERYNAEALEGRQRILGENHPDTLRSVWRMAQLRVFENRIAEAEPFARQALDGMRRVLGEDNHFTITAMGTLANVRQQQGWTAESDHLWTRALNDARRVIGDDHRDTMFLGSRVVSILIRDGKLGEADAQVADLLRHRETLLGENHPDVMESRRMLASLRWSQKRFAEAEEIYYDTLARLTSVQGPAHRETVTCALQLANLLDETGKTADAAALRLAQARAVLEGLRVWEHEDDYPGLFADFYAILCRIPDGGAATSEFVATLRAKYGAQDVRVLTPLSALAWHLARQGRLSEAEDLARESVAGLRLLLPPADRLLLRAIDNLAVIIRDGARTQEALALFETIRPFILQDDSATRDPPYTQMWPHHASCLVLLHRFDDAEKELLADHARLTAAGWSPSAVGPTVSALAELYEAWHKAEPEAGHGSQAALWRARLASR